MRVLCATVPDRRVAGLGAGVQGVDLVGYGVVLKSMYDASGGSGQFGEASLPKLAHRGWQRKSRGHNARTVGAASRSKSCPAR